MHFRESQLARIPQAKGRKSMFRLPWGYFLHCLALVLCGATEAAHGQFLADILHPFCYSSREASRDKIGSPVYQRLAIEY